MIRKPAITVLGVLLCLVTVGAKSPARNMAKKTSSTTTTATVVAARIDKSAAKAANDDSSTISEEIKKADLKTSSAASGNIALVVTITGELKERAETNIQLFGNQPKSLKSYLDILRKARDDRNVKTAIVRISAAQFGFAMAQEMRMAIAELRAKGKKTIGIVEDDSQLAYLVASACDQTAIPPSGELMLYGVKADSYFLKGLFDKLGLKAQVVHIGQYKSFGEMFTNDDFTTPARQNMNEIVDDVYGQMVATIAASRKLPKEEVIAAINRGPASSQEAKDAKLVDRVAYDSEILNDLRKAGATITEAADYSKDSRDKSDDISLFGIISLMNKQSGGGDKSSKFPQVAVVYAVGPITLGASDGVGLSSNDEIASDDFIDILNEVQEDKKIKAVILRVDSPGGSAFASDLIWQKIVELKKVKPVIVSMGDVAASGGYYIAMGATKIIAQEGTLTGSIGVVGGKLNLAGGLDRLGITKTTISRGNFASLYSETSDFSQPERDLIEKMMKRTYDDFVTKAAEGRRMPKEKLNELAQGRVWSGARAKEVGLVDEIGGLAKAVQETKTLIGLKNDDKVSLISYPKEASLIDLLHKALGANATGRTAIPDSMAAALPTPLRTILTAAHSIALSLDHEHVLTAMPYFISIR